MVSALNTKFTKFWTTFSLVFILSLIAWAGSSSVTLSINGLPANTPAAVSLSSFEAGVRLYLNSSTTINDLPSGNYKAAVIPVIANGINYNPQDKALSFFLEDNQNLSLNINYLEDTTVVRNPAVIQTAVARSLPIHTVMGADIGTVNNNQTNIAVQQPLTPETNQEFQARNFLSNSNNLSTNNLSSSGLPGVRPLPFALGGNNSLGSSNSLGSNNSSVSSPPQFSLPNTNQFALQNPAPTTELPFQLPSYQTLFSTGNNSVGNNSNPSSAPFGSYEWQAAQNGGQQPNQSFSQAPIQTPVQNPLPPLTSIFGNLFNNSFFQRPNQTATTQPSQQPVQPAPPIANVPSNFSSTMQNPLLQQPITGTTSTSTTSTGIISNNASTSSRNNTITGKVWQDQNQNLGFEAFESTIEGMRVYLDLNSNNRLDPNEPNTLTNPSGIYEFRNLATGTYKVSQDMPVGWSNLYAGPTQQSGSGIAPQVVGGWNANINSFPFMTALVLNQDIQTANGQRFAAGTRWCGATLIASRWLITAAHCVHPSQNNLGFNLRPEMIGVLHNESFIPTQGVNPRQLVGVRRVITHPSFQIATFRNDIALLELTQPLTQSRALLPNRSTSQQLTQVGNSGTVLGWGSTTAPTSNNASLQFSNQLQQTTLPFINDNQCRQMLGNIFNGENMLCAGLPQGGRDACLGDSGGPLLTRVQNQNTWALVGIISFGEGCAEAGKPGVYTDLGNYFDSFINRYITPEASQSYRVSFNGGNQQQSVYFANFR